MSIPKIHAALERLEHEHNIKILYACELGSRVWGFSSPNSDYDVKFIYVRQPKDYLLLQPKKDTITELAENNTLDLVGWDLRKVLHGISKSSVSIFEWFDSPTIYRNYFDFHADLLAQVPQWFSSIRAEHYYINLVKLNLNKYIDSHDRVIWKKYLMVIRPLLAAIWVRQNKSIPPLSIDTLLQILPARERIAAVTIESMIFGLSAHSYPQPLVGPTIPIVQKFINQYLNDFLCPADVSSEVIPHNVDITSLDDIAARYILEE